MRGRGTMGLWILALAVSLRPAPTASSGVDDWIPRRDLTLRERVEVQRAIERVYYAHQIGTALPFEEAVPAGVIERKVRRHMTLIRALETLWDSPLTTEALERELERIERETKFPERLAEIYTALGNDRSLILEAFAAPILVDRLSRNFFTSDRRTGAEMVGEGGVLWAELEVEIGRPEEGSRGEARSFAARDPAARLLVDHAEPGSEAPGWGARRALLDRGPLRRGNRGGEGRTVREREPDVVRGDGDRAESARLEALALQRATVESLEGDSWANGSLDDLPEARMEHTAVWTGVEMIVWGGTNLLQEPAQGLRYDPLTDRWSAGSSLNAPAGRIRHTAVWTGTEMIVWGGQERAAVVNSGGRYDPVTDTWRPTSLLNAPSPRYAHTAVWTGEEMIVWGGYRGGVFFDSGGRYDPVTDTWRPMSLVNAPGARSRHTAVWTGGQMIVWGGGPNSGGRYDPVTDTWRPTSLLNAPTPRWDHVAAWTGDVMVVWGGFDEDNTGGRYDPITDTWSPTSTVDTPQARNYPSAAWTGRELIVWGGSLIGGIVAVGSGGRYDPVADRWLPVSGINAPLPRQEHTMVWGGDRVLVWGGASDFLEGVFITGGRYDPEADRWTPTATTSNGPEPRKDHSAVWTGTQMIVWGGSHGRIPLQSGARYDPLTDNWTPTTMVGAPPRRSLHTGLWTGQRMLIWGAAGRSGGIYDPLADSWTPTSFVNAPEFRTRHAAVWTGTEALFWGGHDVIGGAYFNTGGRYDPQTNSWRPMSIADAPAGRQRLTAVWTGQEMIVWGGENGVDSLDSGARYDPALDRWTPVSSDGAPTARFEHSTVWDGSRMIVWGGDSFDSEHTGTGGVYDPAADSWAGISTTNAPSPRTRHSAIWTGEEMVVWGGLGVFAVATGGRYFPGSDAWVPTTTVGAPRGRFDHSAVWTGDEMIVWGGAGHISGSSGGGIGAEEPTGGLYRVARSNDPPQARAGADRSFECASHAGTEVMLDGTESSDPDGDTLSFFWSAGGIVFDDPMSPAPTATFPRGTTGVMLTVSDGVFESSDVILVTVDDTIAPSLAVSTEPAVLWPPNHRLIPVAVGWDVSDACDPAPAVTLQTVTSSEPDDGPGMDDGNTVGDIAEAVPGTPDREVLLRSERAGSGPGRTYHLVYTAVDLSGNATQARALVTVPHDLGRAPQPVLRVEPPVVPVVPENARRFLSTNPTSPTRLRMM